MNATLSIGEKLDALFWYQVVAIMYLSFHVYAGKSYGRPLWEPVRDALVASSVTAASEDS